MANKPTYEELEKRVKDLENEALEYKRVNEALWESEKKYRVLFETAKDAVFLCDEAGRFVDANQAACKSLDYSKEELLKLSNKEIDADARGYEAFLKVRDGLAENLTFEVNQRRKDGSLLPVEITGNFFKSKGQKIGVAIARDITSRKQGIEALRESEKFSSSLLDNSPNPIIVINQDTSIRYVNPSLERLTGFSSVELIGKKAPYPWWTEETLQKTSADFDEAMRKGAYKLKQLFQKKGGERFWVKITSRPVRSDGEFKYYLANWVDITELKQVEETLRDSQGKLDAMLQSIGDHISMMDDELNIVWANKIAKKIFGNDIIGKKCYEVYHKRKEPCEPYPCITLKAFKDRKVHEHVTEVIGKDGKTIFFHCTANEALKDENGKPITVIEISRDITELKRAEEEKKKLEAQLQRAQKMEAIGVLAGGIAHDFNNILYPIIGYADLTMDHVPEGSVVQKNLNEILMAANRAKDLVQQILTFSRQSEHERKLIRIQPIIEEALGLRRSSIPTSIQISQKIDKECGAILADSTQIYQVLMNLCTNAHHAMREKGGVLDVTLLEEEIGPDDSKPNPDLLPGTYLKLTVSDTGHGMDHSVMEKIFNPYFTTKPIGEGTGLGLAISHGIVKSYGGDIQVYSEPGKGTTFHVYLPRIKEPDYANNPYPQNHEKVS
ncbi:MAG: hypothetical protein C4B58_00175 [Deltaproteobacteria bacterium]|uniref:Uncharacterized protein n=1 Tax=Candidatus Methanogaster sp. TaxID=3386292 RepID=A0AC61L0M4_9EURY|nr:MAG: hypothetical protein C4B59_11485 [ANME-2 cluster archaeon]PXF60293.1 MAG: hypothetical protein C4B58_00175 [Deltaproteobacteria bacterium]